MIDTAHLPPGPYVFLNHPFDGAYASLFEALLFTVLYCNFFPRHALEIQDSAIGRLEKIAPMIEASSSSIHDLSADRFNMPFEFGLFVGCKRFGEPRHGKKCALAIDADKTRLDRMISDLAGCDCASHHNSPTELIRVVRNFLATQVSGAIPGYQHVVESYERFLQSKPKLRALQNLSDEDKQYRDQVNLFVLWGLFDEKRPSHLGRPVGSLPPMQ